MASRRNMSDLEKKERENFLRHAILVVDHCKDALTSLIERDLQLKGVTFEQFLKKNKHDIIQMCFFESQVELLFGKGLGAAKPGIALEVLDMTLAKYLLVNFCFDVFWDYNLHTKSLQDLLNTEKHTIYHLWQHNSRCCHCPAVFNSTLNKPKVSTNEWQSLFHKPLPQPPCCIKTQANAFPCNSLCYYEAQQTVIVSSLSPRLQKTILDNCCTLRKLIEKLIDIRHFYYGHAANARMTDSDFETNKSEITGIIYHIGKLCGKEQEMKKAIDATLRVSLDHKLVEKYKELMSEIYKNLQQQNEKIQKMESNIVQTNTRVDVVSSSVDHIYNIVDDTNAELERTNTKVDVISNRVDDTKTELGRTNRKVDVISNRVAGLETLQTKMNDTDLRLGKVNEQVEDPVPPNIREQNTNDLKKWKREDEDFVPTRASKHIYDCVARNSCVTITGPAGCGKTFLARHTALLLEKDGYDIIIIKTQKDIRDFYKPGRKTVFIKDDICGNFTASQEKIDNWLQFQDTVDKIVKDKNCKIIVSCRLQVYTDNNFKCLSHFLSCECNLISKSLCLSLKEKAAMIKQFTGEKIDTRVIRQKLGTAGAFLPLLCSLYRKQNETSALEFLQNPFGRITKELDSLFDRKDDSGKYKICSLVLCVLFNNSLDADWFKGKVTKGQRSLLDDLSDACKLDRRLSKQSIEDELNTLVDSFVIKVTEVKWRDDLSGAFKEGRLQKTKYKAIHDKVFDFLAWYFGKKIPRCIIEHGDSDLIHGRFRWNLEEIDKSGDMEYLIGIPEYYLDQYIKRMVTDWSNGKIIHVFNNINMMRNKDFRQLFLRHLSSQNEYSIHHLIERKDCSNEEESTALIQCIRNMYLDIFKWLLNKSNTSVNQTDSMNRSLLYFASMNSHPDMLCTLFEKNPDVNVCDVYGRSPLWWTVCKNCNIETVAMLLQKDANINQCDKNNKSPLWVACSNGNSDMVSTLLQKNPDVNLCYKNGQSPLWEACYRGNVEIVSKLLEKDPDVNLCDEDGRSPLVVACDQGNADIVSKLLQKGSDVNLCERICRRSPLWLACNNGNTEIVCMLLEKDPDCQLSDIYGQCPLWMACKNGHTAITSKLLERMPEVNLERHEHAPLWWACRNNLDDLVSKLLEKNIDVNYCHTDQRSPLWWACARGNVKIVCMLLKKDPDVNICDQYGQSPLFMGLRNFNEDIVNNLLKKNPDVNLSNRDGRSPLWMACIQGDKYIVCKILERKPDVNRRLWNGFTALIASSLLGKTYIVSKLLQQGADCSFKIYKRKTIAEKMNLNRNLDKNFDYLCKCIKTTANQLAPHGHILYSVTSEVESTHAYHPDYVSGVDRSVILDLVSESSALHLSCLMGHTEIVKLLISYKADINVAKSDGTTPLFYACAAGHTALVELLIRNGANILSGHIDRKLVDIAHKNGHIEIVKILASK